MKLSKSDLNHFNYISLHAPDDIIYKNDIKTKILLKSIEKLYHQLNLNLVVFHPNKIKDISIFDKYTFPIAFENLDKIKGTMLYPEDFKILLKKPNFNLVLDLTHAYTNDTTGKLAEKFIKTYKEKIKQIHCSGYLIHGKDEQQHFPSILEKEALKKELNLPHKIILKNILTTHPIIIESVLPKETSNIKKTLKKEFEYIKNFKDTKL